MKFESGDIIKSNPFYSKVLMFFYVLVVYAFWFLYNWRKITDLHSIRIIILFATPYLAGYWFNKKYLFPRFFLKEKLGYYFLFTCLSFVILYFIQDALKQESFEKWREEYRSTTTPKLIRNMMISQIIFFMFLGLGITLTLVDTWIKNMSEIAELKNEKLRSELSSLKNQLSPHFLFNTLNMVYILTQTNSKAASEVSMNLAELMRYQLYGASKDAVSVEEELGFIHNLLKIEKLRKEGLKVDLKVEADFKGLKIQPLIFAPLVENALKHGSQQLDGAEINISLSYQDKNLVFRISNTYSLNGNSLKNSIGGLGLRNLRRRLELSYGNEFLLDTGFSGTYFIAELTLFNLSDDQLYSNR